LSYVETEHVRHHVEKENPRCLEAEEILDEQELTRLG